MRTLEHGALGDSLRYIPSRHITASPIESRYYLKIIGKADESPEFPSGGYQIKCSPLHAIKSHIFMELIIKEGSLTYIKTLDKYASPEDVLIGAYELISKVFSQESVIRAYNRTDPDTLDVRTD